MDNTVGTGGARGTGSVGAGGSGATSTTGTSTTDEGNCDPQFNITSRLTLVV